MTGRGRDPTRAPLYFPPGFLLEPDGPSYLVTDWMAGSLLRIGSSGRAKILLYLNQGSADLEFIAAKRLAIIPMMMDVKVTAYKLD